MFRILIISALMSPALLMADTGETKTFQFTGQTSEQFDLRGELTHTEYRDETVAETCYRQVFSHYESRCHSYPETVCHDRIGFMLEGVLGLFVDEAVAQSRPGRGGGDRPGRGGGDRPGRGGGDRPGRGDGDRPGRGGGHGGGGHGGGGHGGGGHGGGGHGGGGHGGGGHGGGGHGGGGWDRPRCHTEYRQRCSQEAQYRSEAYTCYNTRRISFQVKDADVINHVRVEFGDIPNGTQPNDTFRIASSGRTVSLSASGNNQVIYMLEKQQREDNKGNTVETEVLYKTLMESAAVVNAPVARGVSELTADANQVSFVIGKVEAPEVVVLSLKIRHKKFFGDKTFIERDLRPGEFTLTDMGDKTRVDISVANLSLGDTLSGKKVEVKASVRLNVTGNIANPHAISVARPEQVIEQKIN